MLNVYTNDGNDSYFVGNTITKVAGSIWKPTIVDAITIYTNKIVTKDHIVFHDDSGYILYMEDIENTHLELLI